MTDHTAALRDLAKFRESFVIAVGDKSPFAKQALKLADDAIAALAQSQQPAEPQEPRPRPSWLAGGEEAVAMAREDGLLGDEIERAGHATQQPAGWMPIETAPKTGSTLLLGYFNSHGKWRTLRGEWMSEDYIAEYWDDPDDVEPGWFETSVEADDAPNCWRVDPTHWMPLPLPPTAHPSQQEDDVRDAGRLAELVIQAADERKIRDWQAMHLTLSEAAELARKLQCSCPSGDGSLRHPCPQHPPQQPAQGQNAKDAARYEYVLDCEYEVARKYVPTLDPTEYKAKRRRVHDVAMRHRDTAMTAAQGDAVQGGGE